jgi:Skp family chaperone for outer membrane proteins
MVGAVDEAVPQRYITLSLQRVAAESVEGRAANKRLQTMAQKLAQDLAAKQKELQQPDSGTPQQRQAEFQKLAQQSQAEFQNAQRQLQVEMRNKLNPIVAEIAGQRGVDVVLNTDTIVWASPRLDITGEVLSRLNGTPSPAPVAKEQ